VRDLSKHPSTETLAIAAFEARERVMQLMLMNVPVDYEERKKAAVELAVAREAATYAQQALDRRTSGQ
jgi:hypothetical protein